MDLLDKTLDRLRDWPQSRRDDAAELLLALDELGQEPVPVDGDTLTAIDEAIAQIARGEKADKREVDALFSRYRQ